MTTEHTSPADRAQAKKPRLNQEQYDILLRCSQRGDISEWNQWRQQHPGEPICLEGASLLEAHLEGANLSVAHLEGTFLGKAHLEGAYLVRAHLAGAYLVGAHFAGAYLRQAHLEGVNLSEAHLEGAYLREAHLEKADLHEAHLEGTNLQEAHLEGAHFADAFLQATDCRKAIVDGETLIWGCKVNRWKKEAGDSEGYTDFAGVGLSSARVAPPIRQLLEYNIRRSNWENWYRYTQSEEGERKGLHYLQRFWRKLLVRSFWWLSDYGFCTKRILYWFFGLAGLFAVIYSWCAWLCPPGIIENLCVQPFEPFWYYLLVTVFRPVYFSIVTMTTLGFGDLYANATSFLGHTLLIMQVLLGYLMLAALVTRLAILFTAGGPAGEFTELSDQISRKLIELKDTCRKESEAPDELELTGS